MLEGVYDRSAVIAEDQIRVFPHQLQDQVLFLQVSHLVIMLQLKMNDAL